MRPPPWKYYYWCLPWWLKAIIGIIYAWLQLRLQPRTQASIYAPGALPLRKNPGPGWSRDTYIFVSPWGGGRGKCTAGYFELRFSEITEE